MKPASIAKALVAALVAGVGSVSVAAADGSISAAEWWIAAAAALTSLGAVYQVPNADAGV